MKNLFSKRAGAPPFIKLEFVFKAGIQCENRPEIAPVTVRMLTEGTENHSTHSRSERFDHYGAFVKMPPGFDFTTLSINVPVAQFSKLLPA
jgi:hypothetical protein